MQKPSILFSCIANSSCFDFILHVEVKLSPLGTMCTLVSSHHNPTIGGWQWSAHLPTWAQKFNTPTHMSRKSYLTIDITSSSITHIFLKHWPTFIWSISTLGLVSYCWNTWACHYKLGSSLTLLTEFNWYMIIGKEPFCPKIESMQVKWSIMKDIIICPLLNC
jgi:hypothetical protein